MSEGVFRKVKELVVKRETFASLQPRWQLLRQTMLQILLFLC